MDCLGLYRDLCVSGRQAQVRRQRRVQAEGGLQPEGLDTGRLKVKLYKYCSTLHTKRIITDKRTRRTNRQNGLYKVVSLLIPTLNLTENTK